MHPCVTGLWKVTEVACFPAWGWLCEPLWDKVTGNWIACFLHVKLWQWWEFKVYSLPLCQLYERFLSKWKMKLQWDIKWLLFQALCMRVCIERVRRNPWALADTQDHAAQGRRLQGHGWLHWLCQAPASWLQPWAHHSNQPTCLRLAQLVMYKVSPLVNHCTTQLREITQRQDQSINERQVNQRPNHRSILTKSSKLLHQESCRWTWWTPSI